MLDQTIQRKVDDACQNALDNGFEIRSWTANALTEDLLYFNADFEHMEHDELIEYVQNWKERHPLVIL